MESFEGGKARAEHSRVAPVGQLAQLGEHHVDIVGVIGSSPILPIIQKVNYE